MLEASDGVRSSSASCDEEWAMEVFELADRSRGEGWEVGGGAVGTLGTMADGSGSFTRRRLRDLPSQVHFAAAAS